MFVFFFLQKKIHNFSPTPWPRPLTHAPGFSCFTIMVYNVVWCRFHWREAFAETAGGSVHRSGRSLRSASPSLRWWIFSHRPWVWRRWRRRGWGRRSSPSSSGPCWESSASSFSADGKEAPAGRYLLIAPFFASLAACAVSDSHVIGRQGTQHSNIHSKLSLGFLINHFSLYCQLQFIPCLTFTRQIIPRKLASTAN